MRFLRVLAPCLALLLGGAFLAGTGAGCGGSTSGTPPPPPTLTGVAPASGSTLGGTAISLAGTGFLAGATVTLGGSPAGAVVVVGATTITCTTPPGALGPAAVTVTTTSGAATLPAGFTYVHPAPTIASVTPDVGATSGGMHHVVTGTGFTANAPGPNAVTIGGSPAINVVTVDDTTITCDSPPGAPGPTTVQVTNLRGAPTSPFRFFDPIWAAEGGGGAVPPAVANFHAIDPSTGSAYPIGPIGFRVTGMFFFAGTLWATTAPGSGGGTRELIRIDPTTGAGTLVAPTNDGGAVNHLFRDTTFDLNLSLPFGTDPCQLISTNALGMVSPPIGGGVPSCSPGGGIAQDLAAANVYFMMLNDGVLYTVDTTTGVFTPGPLLSGGTLPAGAGWMNCATFHAGALYAVESEGSGGGMTRQLHRVNTATGVLTPVGPPLPPLVDAIVSPTR